MAIEVTTSIDAGTVRAQAGRPAVRLAVRAIAPRLLVLVLFATAMGYLEAASVLYLRTMYGGIDPVGPRSPILSPVPDLAPVELAREMATLVMLATVAWLAGPRRARFGAFLVAFGVWDITYYMFLRLTTGWPGTLLAPDILFLLPLPWWGPVLAPMLIATLMCLSGGFAMARAFGAGLSGFSPGAWLTSSAGVALCLIAFMADAILALPQGVAAAFDARGGSFPWLLFAMGFALMSLGLFLAFATPTDR